MGLGPGGHSVGEPKLEGVVAQLVDQAVVALRSAGVGQIESEVGSCFLHLRILVVD